jgi:hypothetical protein
MSDFIQKKDYWSIVLFTWMFIGCYLLSKKLSSNNLLVVLPISGLGAFVGYKLGDWVTDKSKGTKVFLVVLWSVMLFGALQVSNNRKNDGKKTYRSDKINLLTGKWETDEDEGFKIRLEIEKDKAYMSLSPDYQKIEYELIYSNSTIKFKKAGSLKFQFDIENIDDTSFTLSQSGETLLFTKVK